MARQIVLCILLLGLVVSCGQSPEGRAAPLNQAKEPEITKKAQEASKVSRPTSVTAPAEPGAWDGTKKLKEAILPLGEEIHREVVKGYALSLKAKDPIETELVAAWLAWRVSLARRSPPEQLKQMCDSILLLRPGKAVVESDAFVSPEVDTPFLRFTRAQAQIDRPLAILRTSWVLNGKLSQAEQILV